MLACWMVAFTDACEGATVSQGLPDPRPLIGSGGVGELVEKADGTPLGTRNQISVGLGFCRDVDRVR